MKPRATWGFALNRSFFAIFAFLQLTASLAAGDWPLGAFEVRNTAGFVQEGDVRRTIAVDRNTGTAEIAAIEGGLSVTIGGTQLHLFRIEEGLASIEWDASGTNLLHGIDIQALLGEETPQNIPVWGASLAWPGAGSVQMVLLPLRQNAYTGFLVSRPADQIVVRQMEFRKISGPSNRPVSSGSADRRRAGIAG